MMTLMTVMSTLMARISVSKDILVSAACVPERGCSAGGGGDRPLATSATGLELSCLVSHFIITVSYTEIFPP